MSKLSVDSYVVETLMRDLVNHSKQPSAFIVYLHLWNRTQGGSRATRQSHLQMADATGLSKSSVQAAVKTLMRRKLIRAARASATAVPEYTIQKPWIR